MSFVDPVTVADPTTGEHPTAALLNTYRANHTFLHDAKPGCRCRTNTATGLTGATPVPFELEDFDTGGCHTTGGSNTRITVPSTQLLWWVFGFCIVSTGINDGFRVLLNGSTVVASGGMTSPSGGTSTAMGFGARRLAVGDYLQLFPINSPTVAPATFNAVFWAQAWRA